MKPPHHVSPHIRWLSAVAVTLVILACGGPPRHITPVPQTTLPPETAPFSVVTLAGGVVQARAGRDGSLLWQHSFADSSQHTLVAGDGVVYHRARTTQDITALSVKTGASLWQFPTCSGYDDSITVASQTIYTTCGTSQLPPGAQTIGGDIVYALDARTGAVRWKAARSHFRAIGAGMTIVQTPTGIAAHDVVTGALLWTHDVAIEEDRPNPVPPWRPFAFAVLVANGMIYYIPIAGGTGEYVEAVRARDGRLLWRSGAFVDAVAPSSDPNFTELAFDAYTIERAVSDLVIVAGPHAVLGLNASDGRVRWHYGYINATLPSVIGDDGTTYVVSYYTRTSDESQQVTALNPEDGSVRWQSQAPPAVQSPMWLSGDVVFISDYPDLWGYDARSGRARWHDEAILPFDTPMVFAASDLVACIPVPDRATNSTRLRLLTVEDGRQVWLQDSRGIIEVPPLLVSAA